MKISSTINLHYYPENNPSGYVREALAFMKDTGFEAADFSMKTIRDLGDKYQDVIEDAIAAQEEFGIEFKVCHLPFDVKVAIAKERVSAFDSAMLHAIDAAALLKTDYAVLHPNTWNLPLEDFNRDEQYDSVTKHLEPFVEHAERLGVKLAIENMRLAPSKIEAHRYCQEPDELCDIADTFGIGVCWDFGHANTVGIKQSEALSFIGKRLKVIHINDNNAIDDDHVPPFCGTVDWRDAMKGLKLSGYAGPFNYEINTSRIPQALRKAFAGYLVECAKELLSYTE